MQTGMKTMDVAAFSHKKMIKTLLIFLFLFSCESITEEIVETHPSGNKKIVIKYNGNRNEENLIGKFYYLDDGTKFNSISYNINGFILGNIITILTLIFYLIKAFCFSFFIYNKINILKIKLYYYRSIGIIKFFFKNKITEYN